MLTFARLFLYHCPSDGNLSPPGSSSEFLTESSCPFVSDCSSHLVRDELVSPGSRGALLTFRSLSLTPPSGYRHLLGYRYLWTCCFYQLRRIAGMSIPSWFVFRSRFLLLSSFPCFARSDRILSSPRSSIRSLRSFMFASIHCESFVQRGRGGLWCSRFRGVVASSPFLNLAFFLPFSFLSFQIITTTWYRRSEQRECSNLVSNLSDSEC